MRCFLVGLETARILFIGSKPYGLLAVPITGNRLALSILALRIIVTVLFFLFYSP